jgi:hypothetical protein
MSFLPLVAGSILKHYEKEKHEAKGYKIFMVVLAGFGVLGLFCALKIEIND